MKNGKGYRNGQSIYPISVISTPTDPAVPQTADVEKLQRAIDELNNWKESQSAVNDNDEIDTIKEVYDTLNDMQVDDISTDEIDGWFSNTNE